MKLTPRQARFVDEYLIDLNGTQAAMRAGYSSHGANVTGSQLLANPSVRSCVTQRQRELATKMEITREGIILGLLEAILVAKKQGDPASMIRGAAEISKMLGFYAGGT